MPWLIFQLATGYLAIGAIVALVFHGLTLALSNQRADEKPFLCLFSESLGETFHDAYRSMPGEFRPLAAIRMAGLWCLIWPLISIILIFYFLHPCALEDVVAKDDAEPAEDDHRPKEKNP